MDDSLECPIPLCIANYSDSHQPCVVSNAMHAATVPSRCDSAGDMRSMLLVFVTPVIGIVECKIEGLTIEIGMAEIDRRVQHSNGFTRAAGGTCRSGRITFGGIYEP